VDLAVGSHGNQFKARVLALLGQVGIELVPVRNAGYEFELDGLEGR
jgi:hypothetical protein